MTKQISKTELWKQIFEAVPEVSLTYPDKEWINVTSYKEDVIKSLQELRNKLFNTEIIFKQSYEAGYKQQAIHDINNNDINNSFEFKDNILRMERL